MGEGKEHKAKNLVHAVAHEQEDCGEEASSDDKQDDEHLSALGRPQKLKQRLVLRVLSSHVKALTMPEVSVKSDGDSQANAKVEEQVGYRYDIAQKLPSCDCQIVLYSVSAPVLT